MATRRPDPVPLDARAAAASPERSLPAAGRPTSRSWPRLAGAMICVLGSAALACESLVAAAPADAPPASPPAAAHAPVAHAARSTGEDAAVESLRRIEERFADAADGYAAIEAMESGLMRAVDGRDLAAWRAARDAAVADVRRELPRVRRDWLPTPDDRRALDLVAGSIDALAASPGLAPTARCADAARTDAHAAALRAALYACFDEHARAIPFEGRALTRVATFHALARLDSGARRQALFLAMQPLWRGINAGNAPDSPYRRMLRGTVADPQWRSPVDDAARALGIPPADVERWLVTMLEAWSRVDAGARIEPWDYRHRQGAALRQLEGCVPRDAVVATSRRYYRDLGADLDALGVVHDVDVRPGKAPLAYSMPIRYGREVNGEWRPTIPRVSANVLLGGHSELSEMVHEDAHAVQFAAIRTRPAFQFDHAEDALYWEAFADVTAWATYDPAWQRKYLGCEARARDARRAQYGIAMLDVAWGLFDVRMLQDTSRDPNAVWTEITSRYLHIAPHPELSWWAQRVQLVDSPGYMVTYALGAALTADLRARIAAGIGPFDTGNPRWYPWLRDELLAEGARRSSSETLARFLGRPPSTDAILAELRALAAIPD